MKTVLLIGSSYSSLPILFYLKKLKYRVYVCGAYKNDPAHLYADKSFFIDYSKKEELLRLCINEHFDFIVPSCNDYAYNSASFVADKLKNFCGFDNFETTMLLHTKSKFRKYLIENNFSSPKKYNNIDKLDFPVLIKPNAQFSGRGIIKINNENELKNINNIENCVIEEYVEGDLYSHSVFIKNGKIEKDFFVREVCSVYEYQVDISWVESLNANLIKKIRNEINRLIKQLNLTDGLLHTQFIVNENNFYLIETMRRCPGDLYGELIKKSTNFDYIKYYVEPFINKQNNFDFESKEKNIIRHTISTAFDINFRSLYFDRGNIEFYPLKESGYITKKAPYDKIGILFYEIESLNEIKKSISKIKQIYKIKDY